MKWCTYRAPDGDPHPGLVVADRIHLLPGDQQLIDLLTAPGGLAAAADRARREPVVALDSAPLLAPIPTPPSIRDFMAFEAHVVTSSAASGQTVVGRGGADLDPATATDPFPLR
jgi:hypothetical protein